MKSAMSRPPKASKKFATQTNAPATLEIPAGGGAKVLLLRLAQLQFSLALLISLYLAYSAFVRGSVAGCGPGSDCDVVLTSPWAYWFNLPVSAPAAAFYVALLVVSLFTASTRRSSVQALAWRLLIVGAFAVLGAALWFLGLQGAIIGSWCPYCVAAHVFGGLGALLLLLAAPFVIRGAGAEPPLLFGVNQRAWPAVIGILALVPLVFGQYLSQPSASVVANLSSGAAGPKTTDAAPAAKPSRKFSLHNGRFTIELHDAPMLGRPDAPQVAVSLFDYTCAHCRKQHALLERVQQVFSNELAIVSLPMPLDVTCNPLLAATAPDHVNACEYARIGMAVWRAKPAVLHEYEKWFFEPEKPRPVAEARAKAIELTGRTDFATLEADPWINDWLKLGRDVFKANWDKTGRSFLPMFMAGPVLSSGEIKTDAELFDLLEKHVGLKRPPANPASVTQ